MTNDSATLTTEDTEYYDPTTLPSRWFGYFSATLTTGSKGWLVLGTTASGLAVLEFTPGKVEFGELIGSTFSVWGPVLDPYSKPVEYFGQDICVEFTGGDLEIFMGRRGGWNCVKWDLAAWSHSASGGAVGIKVPTGTPISFTASWSINESRTDNLNCGICNTCKNLSLCTGMPPWKLLAEATLDGQCYPLTSIAYDLNTGLTGTCGWVPVPGSGPSFCLIMCVQLINWSATQVLVQAAIRNFSGLILLGYVGAMVDRPSDNAPLNCSADLDGLVLEPLDAFSGGSLWGTAFTLTLSVI